ncbi:MAG TPA: glycosyltransferase 87 family protein [Candidatus Limnocylindrales bacterium]
MTGSRAPLAPTLRRLIVEPMPLGRRALPPLGIIVLATLGAILLIVVATSRWASPNDEHAYWLAGQRLLDGAPLYDPSASSITPFAYWYPPVVAQVVAPISAVIPSEAFSWAWTAVLIACLLYLAGGRPLVALALVAYVPVATELGFRNVHLILAVLIVLAIRRWPVLFAIGAAIKIAPGLGIVYLAVRGRWRDAAIAALVGLAILAVSAVLSPGAWGDFIDILRARGPGDASSFVPIPYIVRAVVGLALAIVAGRLQARIGEPLLLVAIVVALPTLWFTALSTLAALVPLLAAGAGRPRAADARSGRSPAAPDRAVLPT